ncbi:hypothetical protein K435DRAFT_773431, partial [Dendrothele bispora CBS 962.96]
GHPTPRSYPSEAYSILYPVKMASNPIQDSQAPDSQPGYTSAEIQGGSPDACDGEVPMNELPQRLQDVLYAIEKVRNGFSR